MMISKFHKFLYDYYEFNYKCTKCSHIFLYKHVAKSDMAGWFGANALQCNKCNQLALLNSDLTSIFSYPYKEIYLYLSNKVKMTKEYKTFFIWQKKIHPVDSHEYIREHLDYKRLREAVELMIEPCSCGGIFKLDCGLCPNCDFPASGDNKNIIHFIYKKSEFCLAPIRPLEDVPKIKSILLQEIFKDATGPKTREDVEKILLEFYQCIPKKQ